MKRGISIFLLAAILMLAFGAAAFAADEGQPAPHLQPQAQVQERKSRRVAMIPLIDRTGGWLTRSAAERLMDRMDREIHIPLNDSMHWVEFLNEDEAAEAFREAMAAQGKKAKPELAAEALDEALGGARPKDAIFPRPDNKHDAGKNKTSLKSS